VVQPLRLPVSKPPLVTTVPPPAGVTVRETVVECVADGPAPVTVTVEVAAGVDAAVVMVRVELPVPVTLVGLKLAVAPAGSPLALRLTVCAAPVVSVVEMVLVALLPCGALTLAGLAAMEKSLVTGALTVSDTVVVWVADGAVPVTVMV